MRKTLTIASALFLAISLGNAAHAAGDAEAGAKKTASCVGCHGRTGKSPSAIYPSLNGRDAAELEDAMKAYRDGERKGGTAAVMVRIAGRLSDQDIADIAAFYSQQE